MKYLYFNPYEYPKTIKLVSKELNIDIIIDFNKDFDKIKSIDTLFRYKKTKKFEEISLELTNHNEAYYKPRRESSEKHKVIGWINLKDYHYGGGYLEDKF